MRRRKVLVTVSALMMASLVLASCSPATAPAKPTTQAPPTTAPKQALTPGPQPPTPSSKPAAEQPRAGGVLTIAHHSNPIDLDPWEQVSIATLALNGPVYSQLFQYDPFQNDKAIADLAEKWELSADNKTMTISLRKGVKWHDGQPFTAEDVKYSLDFMMDAKNPMVARKKLNLNAVNKVEVVDATTLKLVLRAPSASLLDQLALPHSAIGPRHVAEKAAKPADALNWTVVGTGPMKYKNFVKDSYYQIVKNPDYFVKGLPYLDGITFYIVSDPATRFAAFRTGQLKITSPFVGLTPFQAKTVEKETKGVRVAQHPRLIFDGLFMNPERKPWGDVRIRKAVSLATDRQAALATLQEGVGDYASPAVGRWAMPEADLMKLPGYRQPKDADRAEAKKLLAEAGFPDGLKAPLHTRNWTEYVRIAEFMKDQMAKIGIVVTIDAQELAVSTARRRVMDWDIMVATAAVDNADPAGANKYFLKGNDFNFYDKEVEDLWLKQDGILDPVERKKVLVQAQQRFLEVAGWVVLYWTKNITGMWADVKNFTPGVGIYGNLKHEQTWLAK
ncbi:MAG: hypothetical protein HYX92_22545 [Chloroflexi bacterium]|nr:hypothetical protein [Chloroflexota bacterium]